MVRTHKRLTATAATLVALAAGLILCVSLVSSSHPAYALEQTARANDHVTTYHFKTTPWPSETGVGEAWVELDSDGAPLRAGWIPSIAIAATGWL